MLTPIDLLAIAEGLAASIPRDGDYAAERNACWLAIGEAWLKLDDFPAAVRALHNLDDSDAQAQFRAAAGMWAGDHPDSKLACALLRETLSLVDSIERGVSRANWSELVVPIYRVLGAGAVHELSWKLKDPFTATTALVNLAACLPDPGARGETLRSAEEFAKGVIGGNRDYALRWVISGYKAAGLSEDEKRARALMSRDLDLMNDSETKILADAKEALAAAEEVLRPLHPPEADSPLLRLRRFLDYGHNDLRVLFLTEMSAAGGLADPEVESLLKGDAFHRLSPARPPSIYSDPSAFDVDQLAASLFGRPVKQRDSDTKFTNGDGFLSISDVRRFLETVRQLFLRFGEIAPRFSEEQVNQGPWYLFCEPFWLISHVGSKEVPAAFFEDLVRAMYDPFRDYYLPRAESGNDSAFSMWWDNFSQRGSNPTLDTPILEVLRKILALPSAGCQKAALHGLNHLHPSPQAAEIILQFLEANRAFMSEDEIAYAEECLAGDAQ